MRADRHGRRRKAREAGRGSGAPRHAGLHLLPDLEVPRGPELERASHETAHAPREGFRRSVVGGSARVDRRPPARDPRGIRPRRHPPLPLGRIARARQVGRGLLLGADRSGHRQARGHLLGRRRRRADDRFRRRGVARPLRHPELEEHPPLGQEPERLEHPHPAAAPASEESGSADSSRRPRPAQRREDRRPDDSRPPRRRLRSRDGGRRASLRARTGGSGRAFLLRRLRGVPGARAFPLSRGLGACRRRERRRRLRRRLRARREALLDPGGLGDGPADERLGHRPGARRALGSQREHRHSRRRRVVLFQEARRLRHVVSEEESAPHDLRAASRPGDSRGEGPAHPRGVGHRGEPRRDAARIGHRRPRPRDARARRRRGPVPDGHGPPRALRPAHDDARRGRRPPRRLRAPLAREPRRPRSHRRRASCPIFKSFRLSLPRSMPERQRPKRRFL